MCHTLINVCPTCRRIEHAPLKGVKKIMLDWWFSPFLTLASPLVEWKGTVGGDVTPFIHDKMDAYMDYY